MKRLLFTIILMLLIASPCFAATKYFMDGGVDNDWSGDDNWSVTSSAGPNDTTHAVDGDNVILDAGSPACTVDGASACDNLICTGYTGTLTQAASLTVGGTVTLVSGMTYTHGNQDFICNATTALTSGGKSFYNFRCRGAVTCQDAFVSTATVYIGDTTTASFDANDQSMAINNLSCTSSNAKTITYGTGTWTVIGAWNMSGANTTPACETSTVNFTQSSSILNASSATPLFYNVSMAANTKTTTHVSGYIFISNEVTLGGGTIDASYVSAGPGIFLTKASDDPITGTATWTNTGANGGITYRPAGSFTVAGHDFGSWKVQYQCSGARTFTASSNITTTGDVAITSISDGSACTLDMGSSNLTCANLYLGKTTSGTAAGAFDAGSGTQTIGNVARTTGADSTGNLFMTGTGSIYITGVYTGTGITMSETGTIALLGVGTPLVMGGDDMTCGLLGFAPGSGAAVTIPTGTYDCQIVVVPQANDATFNLGGNVDCGDFTVAAADGVTGGVLNINTYDLGCDNFYCGLASNCDGSNMTVNLTTGAIYALGSISAVDVSAPFAVTMNCSGGFVVAYCTGGGQFWTLSGAAPNQTYITINDTGAEWAVGIDGDCSIVTDQTLYAFNIDNSIGSTITFVTDFTVTNELYLHGTAGTPVILQGFGTLTWTISFLGSVQDVQYVNVKNSDASGGNAILAYNGTNIDSGNNANWIFGMSGGGGVTSMILMMEDF